MEASYFIFFFATSVSFRRHSPNITQTKTKKNERRGREKKIGEKERTQSEIWWRFYQHGSLVEIGTWIEGRRWSTKGKGTVAVDITHKVCLPTTQAACKLHPGHNDGLGVEEAGGATRRERGDRVGRTSTAPTNQNRRGQRGRWCGGVGMHNHVNTTQKNGARTVGTRVDVERIHILKMDLSQTTYSSVHAYNFVNKITRNSAKL